MQTPSPIQPIYRTASANAAVELGTHRVILLHGNRLGAHGEAAFSLRMLPSPRLTGAMQVPGYIQTDDITAVEIPAFSSQFTTLAPNVTIDGSGTHLTLRPNPDRIELFRDGSDKLRTVIFHVLNFYDFHQGKSDLILRTDTSIRSLGCIVLEGGGWRVTVQALPETKTLVETLNTDGGYAITHVGKLERVRGGRFEPKDALATLEMLRLFLSFARGSFLSCSLAAGYDDSGMKWEAWGSHIIYTWRHYPGWFSGRPATLLEELYPGFAALLAAPLWKGPLRAVLYWYLRANNTSEGAGVDGGIILAQAALEQLGWVYLVEDKKAVSAQKFDSWNTAKKIAELLRHMDIPLDIPVQSRRLARIAKTNGWSDGPTALVKIRNDLVHAEQRYLEGRDNAFFDAWSLAQRYIELVILRLAGYTGHYTDRISARWVGEVARVPWA